MSISLSLSPRQCPDRYAFRASRNLPDKEFRYLRTVIVTAAVHRGFGRWLPCHQSPGPGHCDPLCEEAPLLPKLRDYFAEFLRESCLAPLGALVGDPGCFPLDDEAYPPSSHWPTLTLVILRSYLVFRVCLDLGEPTSSGFEWHFTPNHNSSVDSSTSVGSDLHLVSPKLHPGHG
ncbi:hypothetical protein VNO80_04845 [Phaseolus coccineus]|uniref:Uncharacterized protein n=1 Tax=Phaseolus coccineus TaxID=3886 RepID=A0AAN9RNK8_PHACN